MKTYKDIAEDPKELKLLAETLVEVADKNPNIADMGICLWDVAEVLKAVTKKIEELEEYKNKAYNYEQGYHIHSLRADEAENKIADHQIRQYSPYDHTKDVFTFQEPPKTGWDLYITPDFTLSNIRPVNWFNRKMQELILGFKWIRQENS